MQFSKFCKLKQTSTHLCTFNGNHLIPLTSTPLYFHMASPESWIKGSLSSSWMNSLIPSLLLPLWQNESLCETIGMKIYVTCMFIHMKIKSFSCEMFCTSTRSEKEANGNSEVEAKPASMCMCQEAHQARAYSSFCSMKHLEVLLLPPGLDVSPSQG